MNGGKVYYALENLLNNNLIKIIQQYNITIHKRIYMDLLEDIIYDIQLNLNFSNNWDKIVSTKKRNKTNPNLIQSFWTVNKRLNWKN